MRTARILLGPYVLVGISAAVLSLGPFLRLGGQALPIPLPYLLLYWVVPAFQGLRDPARFMILAGLCLGVLAAWGAVLAVTHLERAGLRASLMARRIVIWPALWAIVLLECAVGPVPMPRVSVGAQIPAVYRWLAGQPASIPVLELPIGLANRTIWSQQSLMMYYSTYHWHNIVNGVPGFVPPWYYPLLPTWQEFPSSASLRVLRGWGVRYVIVHTAWTGVAAARGIARRASDLHIPVVERFGPDIVYRL